MTVFQEILIVYFVAINVTTFLTFGIDKWKAKQRSWRVSEATLLGLSVDSVSTDCPYLLGC